MYRSTHLLIRQSANGDGEVHPDRSLQFIIGAGWTKSTTQLMRIRAHQASNFISTAKGA
jgi:hypothetical protein